MACREHFVKHGLCYDGPGCAWPVRYRVTAEHAPEARAFASAVYCATLHNRRMIGCVSLVAGLPCQRKMDAFAPGSHRMNMSLRWWSDVAALVSEAQRVRHVAFSPVDLLTLDGRGRRVAGLLLQVGSPLFGGVMTREDHRAGVRFMVDITFAEAQHVVHNRHNSAARMRGAGQVRPIVHRAVWRGAPSGAAWVAHKPLDEPRAASWDLQRVRVCMLSKARPDLLDAAITSPNYSLASPGGRRAIEVAHLQSYRHMSDDDMALHAVQVSVDGFGTTSGLYKKLLSPSVVLKVASPGVVYQGNDSADVIEWWYDRLSPWKHFVPVRADVDDLLDRIEWSLANAPRAMVHSANRVAKKLTYAQALATAAAALEHTHRVR